MSATNGMIQRLIAWLRAQLGSLAFFVLGPLFLACLKAEMVHGQDVVEDRPTSYVGEIIIVGNTVTQDCVILKALGLYPGQVLRYPELRIAERDLSRLNI